MLIKILQTVSGSEDGVNVREFYAGNVYDLHQELALLFISDEKAVAHLPKQQETEQLADKPALAEKAKAPVKNKAVKPAKNKSK